MPLWAAHTVVLQIPTEAVPPYPAGIVSGLAHDNGTGVSSGTMAAERGPAMTAHQKPSADVPPDPRAWLEHFAPRRRSTIANWFHYAVRAGAHLPAIVVAEVQATIARRLQWADHAESAQFNTVLEALHTDRAGALAYAQHVIAYEALPYAQRQHVKAERAIAFLNEVMRGREPTPAQLAYLGSLGYQGESPTDRAEASTLIDALRRKGCGR
jgi:hypothetical protein